MENAYGPASEHAVAVAIELRQRTHKPDETLHTLWNDIHEKVSIAYTNPSAAEQDVIGVEIFTNHGTYQNGNEQRIVLFGEQIPYFNPRHKPRVHVFRVAHTITIESGCEYIVPGNAHFRGPEKGEIVFSPTKGFMEKHRVLVARIVVKAQPMNRIPIRIYNPGATAVTVKKGTVAGVLQTAEVIQTDSNIPSKVQSTDFSMPAVPDHLKALYTESASMLSADMRLRFTQLLHTYRDVFSSGLGDLSHTSLQVVYLEHVISEHGISTEPQKILKVQEWPQPSSISEVHQFVGLASCYQQFVKEFATIAQPLHALTRKYVHSRWTEDCQQAFVELKQRLTSGPILGYLLDVGDLILDMDANDFGIGAILSKNGEEHLLAYGSHRLSQAEQNY
ncbi:hypothetical protein MHYP_G00177370 [Metynnis hypsauchen]